MATPSRPSACSRPSATRPGRPRPSTPSAGSTPCSATTSRLSHRAGQALVLYRDTGCRSGEAYTWDSLGYATHKLGHTAAAAEYYQHALRLFAELGDRYAEADTLARLGDTHQTAGELQQAREAWQQAICILDDLQHPDAGQVRAKLASTDVRDPVKPLRQGQAR